MSSTDTSSLRTLHVANLTPHVTEAHLRDIFGVFGKLAEVEVNRDPRLGLSTCTASVRYEAAIEAEEAVLRMDKAQLDGNLLKVAYVLFDKRRTDSPGALLNHDLSCLTLPRAEPHRTGR